jgi:hypothetical protein
MEDDMKKADEKKIELLVGKLRGSHDQLTHLIQSDPEAALKLLDKARDQLYDLVAAYDDVLQSALGRAMIKKSGKRK